MSQDLVFDLSFQEVPVVINGEEYVLREASAAAAKEYRNAALKSFKMGLEGRPESIIGDGLAGAEPLLVSLCLFKKGATNPVGSKFVDALPSRVVKPLFEKAKEISDLGEGEETVKDLEERIAKLKEAEEMRKNSQKTSSDG